jgi:hypothetical protein
MVTGDGLKARRYAREIVGEMRWRGMVVPRLYARMAGEFEDLVRSGDYAAWIAANQAPAPLGSKSHVAGLPGVVRPDRSGAGRGISRVRRTAALPAPRRGLPLPGPAPGR